ncbi:8-oxo-dGTP pyrophosphatase MutT, NUDIX family [Alteribacillus persepolensis]|uniref:8-oxo-dGTP pyrophosphatase MutT, NUDIX family n=1 Tax=Alteribacillus persepolensis TaxID=568899 RepID=A0A1G8DLF8_9BACI|nr:CoA pyrophosphatase [Alteribacillus persepolensis]SDH58482.1 8-oxo-dGTP pyrophosphatase MutT, NUDIX family [Alteribacillus persepolensis]
MDLNKETITNRFRNRKQGIIDEFSLRRYAVFLPILEIEDTLHLLFEVRAKHMKRQPGEICFPGGMVDSTDNSPSAAAIRELCEEVGVDSQNVTLTGSLDRLVHPFNQVIYPYVGFLDNQTSMSPNKDEVDELFTVPLSYFMDTPPKKHNVYLQVETDSSFPYQHIPNGERYQWKTGVMPEYFYYYKHYVIWGLTARIIKHFTEEIQETNIL